MTDLDAIERLVRRVVCYQDDTGCSLETAVADICGRGPNAWKVLKLARKRNVLTHIKTLQRTQVDA